MRSSRIACGYGYLPGQDLNLERQDQNLVCCQLHHRVVTHRPTIKTAVRRYSLQGRIDHERIAAAVPQPRPERSAAKRNAHCTCRPTTTSARPRRCEVDYRTSSLVKRPIGEITPHHSPRQEAYLSAGTGLTDSGVSMNPFRPDKIGSLRPVLLDISDQNSRYHRPELILNDYS